MVTTHEYPRYVWSNFSKSRAQLSRSSLSSSLQSHQSQCVYLGSIRNFSVTSSSFKKTGKANRSQARTDSSPPVEGTTKPTAVDEAYDFSTLEAKILKAMEHLTHHLSQLRAGGRFNPDHLDNLRVKPIKGSAETVRLGDIAQVVPKGRVVNVIVGEEGHVKPVSSAILESDLNLVPHGPNPDQPTTLTINIPPPTGESRQKAIDEASKTADKAYGEVKDARAQHQKRLRAMQVSRSVRPDDLQKAHKQMEDIVKSGNEEVKRIFEGAKKVLEG